MSLNLTLKLTYLILFLTVVVEVLNLLVWFRVEPITSLLLVVLQPLIGLFQQ